MLPMFKQGAFAIDPNATPDQIAALAAKIDASQAPNPAVNGGRCQDDTITLPRAEVEALMESLLKTIDDYHFYKLDEGTRFGNRKALATLQERMK